MKDAVLGLLIPSLGTAVGSACVFFMKKDLSVSVQRALTGFAASLKISAGCRFFLHSSVSGSVFSSFCCWTISFLICTDMPVSLRGRKAIWQKPP